MVNKYGVDGAAGLTAEQQAKIIEIARREYTNDDVEIDDEPELSHAEGEGCWVAAWVWVMKGEYDPEPDEGGPKPHHKTEES